MPSSSRGRGRRSRAPGSPSARDARRALEAVLDGAVPLGGDDPLLPAWSLLARSGPGRAVAREFVAEGLRVVETVLDHGVYPLAALVVSPGEVASHEPSAIARAVTVIDRARATGASIRVAARDAFRKLAGVSKPRGFLAIARIPGGMTVDGSCASLAVERGLGLAVVGTADPGNVGTLVRTAVAFGVRACFAVDGAVDPFHPKVLRATAGHLLPVATAGWAELVSACRRHGVATAALVGRDTGDALDRVAIPAGPLVVCVGSEGHGLGDRARDATFRWTIPMARAESLNAAVACAIALWVVSRR